MMDLWVVLALVACFLKVASGLGASAYCYTDDNNPYLNFGTKSSYEHHHSKEGIQDIPGCEPVYLWLVSRHGTRWAKAEDMGHFIDMFKTKDMIVNNWNERRGEMCEKDIDKLKAWKFEMVAEQGYQLTEQGRGDLFSLGRRLRSAFTKLIATANGSEKFVIRHTNTSRTKESAQYFYKGVFGLNYDDPEPELHEAMSTEDLIYPYKNCPKFDSLEREVKKERMEFEKGELVKEVVARVSGRLGFDYNLTYENIKSMYDGCRYQKAWFVNDVSPWCAVFSAEDLQILEYNEDIKYYYKSGPGTAINYKLGCPIVKDLIDRFTAYDKDPYSQPRGVFYMSHVTMVNMLTARLDLIDQSEHLKAGDYEKQKHRKYRTSDIVPFAGNVAAVLYRCADGLKVVFYMSERKVLYKGCDDGLCKLSYLRDLFNFTRDEACTETSLCFKDVPAKPGSGAPVASGASTVLCTIVTFILLYLNHCVHA